MSKRNKLIKGKKEIPERKGLFRRAFLYLAVPLTLVGSYFLKDYKEPETTTRNIPALAIPPSAVTDSSKRQKYLEDLVRGIEIPFCSGVVYDNDGSQICDFVREEIRVVEKDETEIEKIMREYEKQFRGGNYDAKAPEILELSELGRKTKIFVGRQIFEEPRFAYLTREDLKSILANHEAQHTIQFARGLGLEKKQEILSGFYSGQINQSIYYALGELDANYSELRRIFSGEFRVSQKYEEEVKRHFLMQYILLSASLGKSSPLQREIIERGLKRVEGILPRGIDVRKMIEEGKPRNF